MATTTIQVDAETHARLRALKEAAGDDGMTFDEVLRLLLDMTPPEEVAAAKRRQDEAYREWQRETADRIWKSSKTRRLF